MSIERHYPYYAAVCDCCEKRLPGELSFRDAVRAMCAAGWERRRDDEDWEDVCTDCLFEEKGYTREAQERG